MKNKYCVEDIIKNIDFEFKIINQNEDSYFESLATILPGNEKSLSFVSSERQDKLELILNSKSRIIICDVEVNADLINSNKCLILTRNPKLLFSLIGNKFLVPRPQSKIHHTAVIDPDAEIALDVFIGPLCVIGKAKIGSGSIIYGNVTIYDNTVIGENVTINSGSVIGAEGFGYNRMSSGEAVQFPHVGGVIIEDNVDIGSNTSIDRGALSNTHIKKGAKIDNLVHIAHNVVVGEHAYVIANAMIGGSTVIGDKAYIAPSASLRDQIEIGKEALVGMSATVLKSIPQNQIWSGNPARNFEEVKRIHKELQKLIDKT